MNPGATDLWPTALPVGSYRRRPFLQGLAEKSESRFQHSAHNVSHIKRSNPTRHPLNTYSFRRMDLFAAFRPIALQIITDAKCSVLKCASFFFINKTKNDNSSDISNTHYEEFDTSSTSVNHYIWLFCHFHFGA